MYQHVTKTEHYWYKSSVICQTYTEPKTSQKKLRTMQVQVSKCVRLEVMKCQKTIWNFRQNSAFRMYVLHLKVLAEATKFDHKIHHRIFTLITIGPNFFLTLLYNLNFLKSCARRCKHK
jgi:hypothetical protein